MAETKTASYELIIRDLKARKYAPIYYLMGDESYYIDKISDFVAENVLKPEERDFNQMVMFGSDVSEYGVAEAARRYPMMAEYQVVIVKEAQNIKNTEAIEAYLRNPLASTVLVMCHKNGTIDKRKKLAAMIAKVGVIFESKKMRERDLPPFIEDYLRKGGRLSIRNRSSLLPTLWGRTCTGWWRSLTNCLLRCPKTISVSHLPWLNSR